MFYVLIGNTEEEYIYRVSKKLGYSRVLKISSNVFDVKDILNENAIVVITDSLKYEMIKNDLVSIGFNRFFYMLEDKSKYIIVGAGADGKRAFVEIGSEKVECFADNYKSGMVLFGKKIISVSEIKQSDIEYRVIIASRKNKYFFEKQLLENGIEEYEIYPETIECTSYPHVSNYGFEREIGYPEILGNYHIEQYKKIAFFCRSDNEKELILEVCFQCGISSILGIVNDAQEKQKGFLNIRYITLNDLAEADCVIIGTNFGDSDIRYKLKQGKHEFAIIDIFDVSSFIPAFHYQNIEKYKNINEGKRCFIIGNGPSLTIKDLDTIYNHKEMSFACNGINLVFDKTQWRPNYYCLSDPWAINAFSGLTNPNIISFLCDWYQDNVEFEKKSNVEYIHYVRQGFKNHPYFSKDISFSSYEGGNVPYDICLQLAVYMGFKEIYLLGIDNTVLVDGECNHFDKDYDTQMSNVVPDDAGIAEEMMSAGSYKSIIERSFESASIYLSGSGVRIYNATRGGRLEVFKRVDFDSLFA